MPMDQETGQEIAKDSHKMTRDDVYKMLEEIAKDQIGKAVADGIATAKADGDKLVQDNGEAAIAEMVMRGPQATDGRQASLTRDHHVAGVMYCLVNAKGNAIQALNIAKGLGNADVLKTIQQTDFAGGGALLSPGFYTELTEYLRARTLVRRLGATSVPLVNGTMALPFIATGSSASYTTEGQPVNATTIQHGSLQLVGKKIMALVPISNDWLRTEGAHMFGGANLVSNDLGRAFSVTEDAAFIRGQGSAGTPKGIRYWAADSNVQPQTKAAGTVTVAEAGYDLLRCMYFPRALNVDIFKGGYMFSPRTWLALMSGRDANSNLIWAPEMATGSLLGQKFGDTTSIPDNIGGSASELVFCSFDTAVIGEETGLTLDLFDGVSYLDASGTMKSGVSQDESVARVLGKHDFGLRHNGAEASVITGIDWTQLE